MTKTASADSDPTVEELKEQLSILVGNIVEEDDFPVETVDRTREVLSRLKAMKTRKFGRASNSASVARSQNKEAATCCPEEFKCPLSKELMRDPVVLSTGQTYDRPFIQKWLKDGNRICPLTKQVLSRTVLTPNHLVKEIISQWCKNQGFELPDTVNEDGITEADRDRFLSLLDKMSSSATDQKKAAKELRSLTKKSPEFRVMFGESPEAIRQLLTPLSGSGVVVQPDIQEDVITTLLNLSINDSNKKFVAETPIVIPLLKEALMSGTVETRANAAAALFTLAALDSNKILIGKAGCLKQLLNLIEEGPPMAMKDAASSIFSLCLIHENRAIAVREGAVSVILKKIMESVMEDELLAILAILSSHHRAVEELGCLDAAPCLLRVVRQSGCERKKENCIAILCTMCCSDRRLWRLMREEESSHGTISKLAEDGTQRARRKATWILERLNRAHNATHTA